MNKTFVIAAGLLLLFVALRAPGLSLPYHQDEFKTAVVAQESLAAAGAFLTHPPLTALIYRTDVLLFGDEYLRLMPLLFGLLSAALLFLYVRRRLDERAALWALGLYAASFYGVWASLMLDTDGAILPTFFLAALYCWDRLFDSVRWRLWVGLLVLTLVLGLLVKLSFVLVVGLLAADYLLGNWRKLTVTHIFYGASALGGLGVLAVLAFLGVHAINPTFQLSGMIEHALYYVDFSERNYLQVVVQSVKAVYYLSPLLLVPLLWLTWEEIKQTRIFFVYLALGFVFYFVLFDFSKGALDKYLMFTIIPLCVISGMVLSRVFRSFSFSQHKYSLGVAALVGAGIMALAFVPPEVVALYPKTAWFSRVLSGHWNVLAPFTGGSGPAGFYVSFLVIGVSFIIAGGLALLGRFWRAFLGTTAVLVVSVGIAYNVVFIEEFAFGKLYGNTPSALRSALAYIEDSSTIQRVVTYNDIGAYELTKLGKYEARFYAAPQFEEIHRTGKFSEHDDAYLVVGMPPLYEGFYRNFFAQCSVLFTSHTKVIESNVYICESTKASDGT